MPASWIESRFNPLLLRTKQGQTLLHALVMSTFLRDGHSVGVLTTWDNPMRFELRRTSVDKLDRLVSACVRACVR